MTHADLLNHATAFTFPLNDGGLLQVQKTARGFTGSRSYPRPHPMASPQHAITRDGSFITRDGWVFYPKPESAVFPTLEALATAVNAIGSADAVPPPEPSGVFAVVPPLDKATQTTDSRDYSSELGCRGISDQRL